MKFIIIALVIVGLAPSCRVDDSRSKTDDLTTDKRIFDYAELLTKEEEDSLFSLIKELEDKVGSQIGILTVDTLNGENINSYSLRMANEMGLGRVDYDDGILITVAVKDQSTRIEVGYGLEKIIKDEIAARIISENMFPEFRTGNFFAGLESAVVTMKELIEENKDIVGQR
jgi:uncharacterized protein